MAIQICGFTGGQFGDSPNRSGFPPLAELQHPTRGDSVYRAGPCLTVKFAPSWGALSVETIGPDGNGDSLRRRRRGVVSGVNRFLGMIHA